VFISLPGYYAGMAMFGIACAVLWISFIFISISLTGFYFKIRRDQDFILIYILTAMCLFAGIHCTMVTASMVYKPPMDCFAVQRGGTLFFPSVKALFFVFLARKAKLVQYSANASNRVFIAVYVLIGIYFVYYYAILLIPGILSTTNFTDPSNGLGICLYKSAAGYIPSGSLVFEVILNLLNLYMFIKPLRAHELESQAIGNSMSAHTKVLGEVIRRNMKGSVTSIVFTICTKLLSLFVLSKIPGDLGIFTLGTAVTLWDETLAILCLFYVCHNAFEIPCMQQARPAITTNTSAVKNNDQTAAQV